MADSKEKNREKTARYRARLAGLDVPILKRGPKPGYKQSPEHVAKRSMWGDENPKWRGDDASNDAGRMRARRLFVAVACSECGAPRAERHHIDENPLNNDPSNIAILCRSCHMFAHSRSRALRG